MKQSPQEIQASGLENWFCTGTHLDLPRLSSYCANGSACRPKSGGAPSLARSWQWRASGWTAVTESSKSPLWLERRPTLRTVQPRLESLPNPEAATPQTSPPHSMRFAAANPLGRPPTPAAGGPFFSELSPRSESTARISPGKMPRLCGRQDARRDGPFAHSQTR